MFVASECEVLIKLVVYLNFPALNPPVKPEAASTAASDLPGHSSMGTACGASDYSIHVSLQP